VQTVVSLLGHRPRDVFSIRDECLRLQRRMKKTSAGLCGAKYLWRNFSYGVVVGVVVCSTHGTRQDFHQTCRRSRRLHHRSSLRRYSGCC